MTSTRLTKGQRHAVGELVHYLGVTAGVSQSIDEIAARLPAHQRRSAQPGRHVVKKMTALAALGLVTSVDGGWALTEAGAAMIRRDIEGAQAALGVGNRG